MRHRSHRPWTVCSLLLLYTQTLGQIPIPHNPWDVFPNPPLVDLPIALPNSPTLAKSIGDAAERVTRWTPPAQLIDWSQRRPKVDRAFRLALGLDPLPDRSPLNARVLSTHDFARHSVDNIVFESRPGFPVTANLYRPRNAPPGRRPTVLSPIGHFLTPGKTAPEVQARCIGLAHHGFLVLVYDAIGQGERMTPGNIHHDAGYALLPLGETIAGWMVWDSMRALDYLASREDVDPSRIGLTGNSGGGLNTLFTAALDSRIHAAVVTGFTFEFGNWAKYAGAHCTCTHLPGIFDEMNWFELAGLIAPRALRLIQGGNDGIFPISGARRSAADVRSIYSLTGHTAQFSFIELPGLPHAYSRPFRESMYGWMAGHLLNQGDFSPIPEPEFQTLPERDPRLLCDPQRLWMPQSPTVVDLARRRMFERWAHPKNGPMDSNPQLIRDWVRQLTAPPEALPQTLAARVHSKTNVAYGTLEKLSFNSEDGQKIPALLWQPHPTNASGHAIIVADSRGKSAIAESGLVPPLLESGYTVLAPDLRGRGETLGYYSTRYNTNFRLVANQILLGRPLAGRRAFDLSRAIDFLVSRSHLATNSIAVLGHGDDALPALLAAIADPRIRKLALASSVHSFVTQLRARTPPPLEKMGDAWNDPQLQGRVSCGDIDLDFGSTLPGALNVADIPELLALISPRPILFRDARDLHSPDAALLQQRFIQRLTPRSPSFDYAPDRKLDATTVLEWLRKSSQE